MPRFDPAASLCDNALSPPECDVSFFSLPGRCQRSPASGENEYMRGAVRCHQLFWGQPLAADDDAGDVVTPPQ